MTHLLLSHLSKDNNDPVMVQQLFEEHAEGIQVIVASRYIQTAVYSIQTETGGEQPVVSLPNGKVSSMQLSLF